MPRLTVNGQPVECRAGATLLEAARLAGADVPTLCDDPRLKPIGACRLCVVHVRGLGRPVTACNTPAVAGAQVETHPPEIEESRRVILRLLARQYPAEALELHPDKPFHRLLRTYGLHGEATALPSPHRVDDSHPYVRVDMSQCVHCLRCVRICEEVQGQFVWRLWGRGDGTRILPDSGDSLLASSCVSCGACVDTCPSGALVDQSSLRSDPVAHWTRTTCPYCGTGCEMEVGTSAAGAIVAARPVLDAPVSKGHLCVKGRYAHGFNDAPDRVTSPMIRRDGRWATVSWEEAIRFVADGLTRVIARHGPQAVGMLGSARATNEDNYLTQKFARLVLGTNNVDCCARVCHAPTAEGMKSVLGAGAATNSFDDIERAATILIFGCNPTENHPIVGARIKQAAIRGARLIVVDPRRTELADYATVHLPLHPGTNVPLLNAMAHTIVGDRLWDDAFVRARVDDFDAFLRFVDAWSPEQVAPLCGVEANLIRDAARLYASAKPAMCFHGLGVTEHVQGTDGVVCLINLALLTGNLGRPGSGVNPLRGQNNVQGAAHMGCEPASLTGGVALEAGRALFERTWNAPLPQRAGLNAIRMLNGGPETAVRALWAIGYDVALTHPNTRQTLDALEGMELVIVQDMFLNRVAEHATVFLPAASPFEKDGTFMNAERRVQRVRQACEPKGQSKPDWQILCDVAKAMGFGCAFAFESPEQVWDEIRNVWPAGRGMTYERLDRGGLQWPCPSVDHPGTPVLHVDGFPSGPRASLRRVDFTPTPEATDAAFPLLLTTGRTLYQFNAGTMTSRTPNAMLEATDHLAIAPGDATLFHVSDGRPVRVVSRYGEATLTARIDARLKPGELFATFHTPGVFLNQLTGPQRDTKVDTPEYKVTAVRVEPTEPSSRHDERSTPAVSSAPSAAIASRRCTSASLNCGNSS